MAKGSLNLQSDITHELTQVSEEGMDFSKIGTESDEEIER
jgi:hypothetical protein